MLGTRVRKGKTASTLTAPPAVTAATTTTTRRRRGESEERGPNAQGHGPRSSTRRGVVVSHSHRWRSGGERRGRWFAAHSNDEPSKHRRSEEHTSELQS